MAQGLLIQPIVDQKRFQDSLQIYLNQRPPVPDTSVLNIDDRRVNLFELHREVMLAGSGLAVTNRNQWPFIATTLGFDASPATAQRMQHVWSIFLQAFEAQYINAVIKSTQLRNANVAAINVQQQTGSSLQQPVSFSNMNPQQARMLELAQLSVEEMRLRGESEQIIQTIEADRQGLQRLFAQRQLALAANGSAGAQGPRSEDDSTVPSNRQLAENQQFARIVQEFVRKPNGSGIASPRELQQKLINFKNDIDRLEAQIRAVRMHPHPPPDVASQIPLAMHDLNNKKTVYQRVSAFTLRLLQHYQAQQQPEGGQGQGPYGPPALQWAPNDNWQGMNNGNFGMQPSASNSAAAQFQRAVSEVHARAQQQVLARADAIVPPQRGPTPAQGGMLSGTPTMGNANPHPPQSQAQQGQPDSRRVVSVGTNAPGSMDLHQGIPIQPIADQKRFQDSLQIFLGQRPPVPDTSVLNINDSLVNLFALHTEVMLAGSGLAVTNRNQWPFITTKLGFDPSPAIAQRIHLIWSIFLQAFEGQYINAVIKSTQIKNANANAANVQRQGGSSSQHQINFASMNQQQARMLDLSHLSAEEMRMRGESEQVIHTVGTNRQGLQSLFAQRQVALVNASASARAFRDEQNSSMHDGYRLPGVVDDLASRAPQDADETAVKVEDEQELQLESLLQNLSIDATAAGYGSTHVPTKEEPGGSE